MRQVPHSRRSTPLAWRPGIVPWYRLLQYNPLSSPCLLYSRLSVAHKLSLHNLWRHIIDSSSGLRTLASESPHSTWDRGIAVVLTLHNMIGLRITFKPLAAFCTT